MIRHLARTVVGMTMIAALGSGSVHATASTDLTPEETAFIDAQVMLDSEILVLVDLGAFGDAPPQVLIDVHEEWKDSLAGLGHGEIVDWAIESDHDGADILNHLRQLGYPPTPAVEQALGPLSQQDRDALLAGRRIAIDPMVYVRARGHLADALAGRAPADVGVPPASLAPRATQPAVTTPSTTPITTPAVVDDASPSGTVLIGMVAALVVAIGGLTVALIARRRHRAHLVHRAHHVDADEQFDLLSEAARRMTGALDHQEIARIALEQAMEMVRARHAAFVDVGELGLTATATAGDVFSVRTLTGGLLSRVADTGQTVRRVAHDEPAITSLPAALLASPIIGGGRVIAILFLVRPDAAPFGEDDEDAITRLGPIVASALAAASKHGDVTAASLTDPLTGLGNRRKLDDDLAALAPFAAPGRSTGVVMVDVDHFKHFNDRNGHAAGDEALRAVARALQSAVRPADRVYRYGGEEFSLVLADIDRRDAEVVAERVRATVEASSVPGSGAQPGGALTVSVGVALVSALAPEAALRLADRALYEAKAGGRNRVVLVDGAASAVS